MRPARLIENHILNDVTSLHPRAYQTGPVRQEIWHMILERQHRVEKEGTAQLCADHGPSLGRTPENGPQWCDASHLHHRNSRGVVH